MKNLQVYIQESISNPIDKVVDWLRSVYKENKPTEPTAGKNQWYGKFANFIYMIQPAIRDKTFTDFKNKNKGMNPMVMQFYNKLCSMTYEDYMDTDYFFKTITNYVEAKAAKLFSSQHINNGDISKLNNEDSHSIIYYEAFPQYVTYKYTVLKNEQSLENFIFKNFEQHKFGMNNFRKEEDIQNLLVEITKLCDTLLDYEKAEITGAPTIKKALTIYRSYSEQIYSDIYKIYAPIFEKYETFISGLIAEQDNNEKQSEFDTTIEPEK